MAVVCSEFEEETSAAPSSLCAVAVSVVAIFLISWRVGILFDGVDVLSSILLLLSSGLFELFESWIIGTGASCSDMYDSAFIRSSR